MDPSQVVREWAGVRRVCDQLVHNSPIGWWWGSRAVSQALTLSVLGLQEAWGYLLLVVNIFYLLERLFFFFFLHLQNNSGNVHQLLLSRYFREELKQRIWGRACPRKAPMGSCLVTIYQHTFLRTMVPETINIYKNGKILLRQPRILCSENLAR